MKKLVGKILLFSIIIAQIPGWSWAQSSTLESAEMLVFHCPESKKPQDLITCTKQKEGYRCSTPKSRPIKCVVKNDHCEEHLSVTWQGQPPKRSENMRLYLSPTGDKSQPKHYCFFEVKW